MSGYSNLSTEDQSRVIMSIFNAYLLPGGGHQLLYDSVSPVNTFRLVFNFYLNYNFELLDDRNYRSPFGRPYEFEEVTDLLAS